MLKHSKKQLTLIATGAAAALLLSACSGAGGGEFPSQRIEVIVPFAAGGGTDQIARVLTTEAEKTCDTTMVISNVTGATGTIGLDQAIKAAPDGYTIGVGSSSPMLASLFGTAGPTPEDLRGVMQFNSDPAVIAVNADSEYDNLDDFLAAAESSSLKIGTAGSGSIGELAFSGLGAEAGVEFTNVAYEGAAPAILGLLNGEADAVSASGVEMRSQIENGDVRVLAVMDQEPIEFIPDVPTLEELGYDWTAGVWRGQVINPETPDDVVTKLSDCFHEAYESPAFTEYMKTQGYGLVYRDAAEFDTFLSEDYASSESTIADMQG